MRERGVVDRLVGGLVGGGGVAIEFVCERERLCVREREESESMFVQERDRLVGGLVGGGSVAIEFVVSDLEAHLEGPVQPQVVRLDVLLLASDPISVVNRLELVGSTDLHSSHGRGAARAEDAQVTPTQSHIPPSIL